MVIPLSNANLPEQVIIYQNGQVFTLPNHLKGRVGFVATMPSTSASIFINNTQLSDTGTYQCLVNNFPDGGGRNIGVIGLTVLVPPSVPACRIQGTLDVGSDIMLFCSSEEGIPTPSYSWEKLDALPKLPYNAMQDQMQGTVTLRNISTSTSGFYQCTSSNAIGKSTCVLNLEVVAPQPQSVGLIAGTIATGILAVIICSLLVVVTLFYWKNKNRYEEEEIPNEIREDDLPPKRSSSENDTLTSTNTYNSRYWHNPKTNYDTNSYTRYNGDTRQTFTAAPTATAHGPHGAHSHGQPQNATQATLERMGAVPVMVPAQSRAGSLV
uniref:Immunoglobulin superfamily member 11 n=1 Tax=Poecilia formosa TaxID=48698 RepID=A0A096MB72_POEFO